MPLWAWIWQVLALVSGIHQKAGANPVVSTRPAKHHGNVICNNRGDNADHGFTECYLYYTRPDIQLIATRLHCRGLVASGPRSADPKFRLCSVAKWGCLRRPLKSGDWYWSLFRLSRDKVHHAGSQLIHAACDFDGSFLLEVCQKRAAAAHLVKSEYYICAGDGIHIRPILA